MPPICNGLAEFPLYTLPMRFSTAALRLGLFPLLLLAFFLTHPSPATALQASTAAPAPDAVATSSSQTSTPSYRLPPEKYEKAVAFSRAGYRVYFVSVFWNIAVLLVLLHFRFFAGVRDFAESRTGRRSLQAAIIVPTVFVSLALLNLPFRIYWHHLSLSYQQSVQAWGSWFWDWTKAELLTIGLALLVCLVIFRLLRRKPRAWWFYAWLGAIPFTLLIVFVAPWYIDPLFNRFRPLEEKYPQLAESIVTLTNHAGHPIPPSRIFLMEASAKTNAINAYVTGLGTSTRIVIWDTSIRKSSPDELLCIVGHEMGHYVFHHVFKGVAFFLGTLSFALYLAYRSLEWLLARWGLAWGIRASSDWAALGVLLLLLNAMAFFGEPIGNAFSRMEEHAADVYGLEVVQGLVPNANEVTAHSFQVLGEEDLDDPNPSRFIVFWLYTHPPLNERLRFAHDFKPSWPNHYNSSPPH